MVFLVLDKFIYKLVHYGKKVQKLGPVGREMDVFKDDVFVVSYPKSGNTWVRFMLGNLFYQDIPVTFENVECKVPDIYQSSGRYLEKLPRPRILKSHEYLDPRYQQLIYIVRDPRDVAISYYHYLVKMRVIEDGDPFDAYVEKFVSGDLDSFGSWGDNVGGWVGARKDKEGFLLLRYEDMLENPVQELEKVVGFLQCSASETQIRRAVELSSFERMQELEKAAAGGWKPTRDSRQDKPFIRTGQMGGWRTQMSKQASDMIEQSWGDLMVNLGYVVGEG